MYCDTEKQCTCDILRVLYLRLGEHESQSTNNVQICWIYVNKTWRRTRG